MKSFFVLLATLAVRITPTLASPLGTSPILALPVESTSDIVARQTQGQVPMNANVKITKIALTGNGCPDKSNGMIKYLDEKTVTLIFDKFRLFNVPAEKGKTVKSSMGCEITVNLDYAGQFKAANITSQVRGDGTVAQNATWGLFVGTTWVYDGKEDKKPESKFPFPSPFDRTFTVIETRPMGVVNPYCSPFSTVLKLSYRFDINNTSADAASVQVFSTDYTITTNTHPRSDCPKK